MHTPSSDSPLLHVARLNFGYPGLALFEDLSASIPAGVTLVRGGDGRGKTTLLQLLGGLIPVQDGVLALDGVRLDADSEAYRRRVFYVDPRTEIYDQLTPLAFFGIMRERFHSFDETRLPALTEGLSLTPHLEKKLFMLSTGSKRKVYLAAAFAAGATLNLLDDPFAGLDRASINFVVQQLNAPSQERRQAWVVAMYEAPVGVTLAASIDLGD